MSYAGFQTEEQTMRGLQTVRVRKDELIDKVQKNRDDHRQIFEEAIENWKKEITKQLEQAVLDAREAIDWKINFGPRKPEDHTKEYDQVLMMLKMSQDDELELTAQEFAQFVMDEWGWQHAFLASNASLSDTASAKLGGMYGK